MLWTIIFQIAWGEAPCSSPTVAQIHTLQVLQEYLSTKDCQATVNKLEKVKSLSLVSKDIQDISILSRAAKLEYLNLSKNQIEDVSPLSNLSNLKWLDLSMNPIESMKELPSQSLETFWCVECQIHSWETKREMRKLLNLSLRSNQLTTIEIDSFPVLRSVMVSNNEIVDPSSLEGISKLRVIDLYGNPIDEQKCPRDKDTKPKALRAACSNLFGRE